MRFLNRQLLRSVIAAGLVVVGATSGLAAPGKVSAQWKDFCLVNDVDAPFPTSLWRTEDATDGNQELKKNIFTEVCTLEARECFIASSPVIKFIAQEDINAHLQNGWRNSLQTSNQWLTSWIRLRSEVSRRLPQQTAKLIQSMNFIAAVENEKTQEDLPTYFSGNLFVYVIDAVDENSILSSIVQHPDVEAEIEADIEARIAADVASEFDEYHRNSKLVDAPSSIENACPAEAYFAFANRPPELQGDLAGQSDLTDSPSDFHRDESTPSIHPLHLQGLLGRSAIESWLDPNWDVHTWAYSSSDILASEAPAYEAGAWSQPILDRWIASLYSIQASMDWDRIREQESQIPEPSALVSVTSGAVISGSANPDSSADTSSSPEIRLEEASRIATKVFAQKLKQLGELLIDSADRLNQVSEAIDVASRIATQR